MHYQSIEEIYEANDKIREKLKALVSDLSDGAANNLPEGEKWTIAEIVEHLAKVEDGMGKISRRLLTEAQNAGKSSDGRAMLSEEFKQKLTESRHEKFDAPDRVRPEGNVAISESLKSLDTSRARLYELKPLFEAVDCMDFKFPHPLFGDLTAHEWLALVGGHEMRHISQIKKLLKIG